MPNPKKRSTKSHKKTRGAHFALKPKRLEPCPSCGNAMRRHFACPKCNAYKKRNS